MKMKNRKSHLLLYTITAYTNMYTTFLLENDVYIYVCVSKMHDYIDIEFDYTNGQYTGSKQLYL